MAKVSVKQDEEKPVEVPVLAEAIVSISRAMMSLSEKSRLNRNAIVTLIAYETGIARKAIDAVLDNLAELESKFVVPQAPAK